MANARIGLTDSSLFGNDDAEDEAADVFRSYVVEREEIAPFIEATRHICVARAFKGDGKSALLRLAREKVSRLEPPPIVVASTALELAPKEDSVDYGAWVRGWKSRILGALASEIGSQVGVAWSDDAMALVEEAERSGSKSRNLIGSIVKRLIPSLEFSGVSVRLPEGASLADAGPVLQRWLSDQPPLWLFVDDVDKNFENTPQQRVRVASFFDACRAIVLLVPQIRIRAAVRPNVWTTLKMSFESLSHMEQYMVDLSWSEEQIRTLLACRVQGYLRRSSQWQQVAGQLPRDVDEAEKEQIALVFDSPMQWGSDHRRPAHVVLFTLSKHRPRWVIELAKVAAGSAAKARSQRIRLEDIVGNLEAFGGRRISDTVAEFSAQCPEIGDLISAFSRQPEEMSTDELFKVIENNVLSHVQPHISGVPGRPNVRQVASFLFEIGLFFGRRERDDGSYDHFTFVQRPTLFLSRTAVDAGLRWEIHPVFRQALEMRDRSGREVRQRSRSR